MSESVWFGVGVYGGVLGVWGMGCGIWVWAGWLRSIGRVWGLRAVRLATLHWAGKWLKPRPESGLDHLTCVEFSLDCKASSVALNMESTKVPLVHPPPNSQSQEVPYTANPCTHEP